MIEPVRRTLQLPADAVYAVAILSPTRLLATTYWARYESAGPKPLVLCDYEVGPLTRDSWRDAAARLNEVRIERKSRLAYPLGFFVENETIALKAQETTAIDARPIAPWLLTDEIWSTLCQSAALFLSNKDVGFLPDAQAKMAKRPFLNEAGVATGPRPDDPTFPAFLFGVVIGLDEIAARDPKPKPPRAARKN